jgi:hypothetical protein
MLNIVRRFYAGYVSPLASKFSLMVSSKPAQDYQRSVAMIVCPVQGSSDSRQIATEASGLSSKEALTTPGK